MNLLRSIRLSILFAAIPCCSSQSLADTWQNTVSASLTTEYDSNPTLSPTSPKGVWRGRLEPAYVLTGISDDNELRTGIALQIARSSDETLSPKRNSPSVFIDWLHHIDDGEFGLSSRYAEIATRDATIEATGPVPVTSTRASRSVSARLSQALSARGAVAVDGAYERFSYEGGTFVDYATRSANLMLSYATSESSTTFIKASYADYKRANSDSIIRVNSGVLGVNFEISDHLAGSIQAGKYQFSESAEQGTIGEAALRYTGEQTQLSITAGRQVSPSGLGGFTTVDLANASWSYALSELSTTGIDLGWRRSNFNTAVTYRTSGIWLRHELSASWGMRLYYLRNMLDGDVIDAAFSNIYGLNLAYTHTDF